MTDTIANVAQERTTGQRVGGFLTLVIIGLIIGGNGVVMGASMVGVTLPLPLVGLSMILSCFSTIILGGYVLVAAVRSLRDK